MEGSPDKLVRENSRSVGASNKPVSVCIDFLFFQADNLLRSDLLFGKAFLNISLITVRKAAA